MATPSVVRGPWRWLARLPIHLYRCKLGWLLGHRFLLLFHRGRNSGVERQVVLEVARYDATAGHYVLVSAWGEKSQWYQNLLAHPEVTIQVGRHRYLAHSVALSPSEGEQELENYARRNPAAAWTIRKLFAQPGQSWAQLTERFRLVRLEVQQP